MSSSCQRAAPLIVVLLTFSVIGNAHSATQWLDERWQVSGFGTLGYSQTDKYDDRIARRNVYQSGEKLKDNGFLMDSRLGLQLKGQLSDHWEMLGQVVLREQFANNIEDYISMAFIRYRFDDHWQVSLGRQAIDLFFLSDHRNASYSYDWVRPPTEFYGYVSFDSFDGIKVSKDWGPFDSNWRWSLSIGNSKAKVKSNVQAQGDQIDRIKAKPIYNTELRWQTGPWVLRGSFAILNFVQDLWFQNELEQGAAFIQPLWPDFDRLMADFPHSYTLRYASLGLSWQKRQWKVQGEWNIIDANHVGFNGQRGYLHFAKRWQNWQPFITLGYADDDSPISYAPPTPGIGLDLFYDGLIKGVQELRHNQTSISLGLRWDFSSHKALKLQCDQFSFKSGSGSIYGQVDQTYNSNKTSSWCSVALDWVF